MTAKLHVLQVVPDLDYGGLQRLVVDTCRLLPSEAFVSSILSFAGPGALEARLPPAVQLHRSPPMSRFSMFRPRSLARLLVALRPDVVHTHSGVWYKVALAARMAGVPRVIHTDHGRRSPDPWQDRLVDGLASRYTDVVVAVSEVLATHLQHRVVHDASKVRLLINGVDTLAFQPLSGGRLREEIGLPSDALIIGSIGRLETIKGYDIMLDAFAALQPLSDSTPPAYLVLAGDGSERAMLEARAVRLGIRARVHFLGFRADSGALLGDFTLFTLTSRSEGTSVSLLEAMSTGVCPVVTDVGGNCSVLGAGLSHRLVPPLDPVGIARGWQAALADPSRRQSDGILARRRVESAFSLSRMVEEYAGLYRGR